jgi:hypothetical protein
VANGAQRDVGLGDLPHGDGGLDAGLDACLLQEVLQGQTVHDGAEHAHVVGATPLHASLLQLGAAEEVAATGHDGDLGAAAGDLGDLVGDAGDDVGIDADGPAPERLPGQLQQDAVVRGHRVSFVGGWTPRIRPAEGPDAAVACAPGNRPQRRTPL